MKLSVILSVYNEEDTISEQMEALAKQEWNQPWEVVVVDNRSTDNSIEIVNSFKGKIRNLRVVKAYEKQGLPYARNVGVENAKGEYLAFCDADDIVGDNYIASIGDALSKHDFVACKWELNRLNSREVLNSRGKGQSEGLMSFSLCDYLPHAAGCSLGIKKRIHEEVEGFDENFTYLQDTDYCWKVQIEGYKLTYVPEAIIHYRFRTETKKMFKQSMNWGEYSIRLYKKYQNKGMPKRSYKKGVKQLYRLLRTSYRLLDPSLRYSWITSFGRQIGRIKGAIKYRILVF